MEQIEKKILGYLKKNTHKDIEIADVAFQMHSEEQAVQQLFNDLYRQGLVSARQSVEGRIYWYAVNSSGVTPSNEKENNGQEVDIEEDEFFHKPFPIVKVLLIILVIIVFAALSLTGFYTYDKRVQKVSNGIAEQKIQQVFVPYSSHTDSTIQSLDQKISILTQKVDSLQTIVDTLSYKKSWKKRISM